MSVHWNESQIGQNECKNPTNQCLESQKVLFSIDSDSKTGFDEQSFAFKHENNQNVHHCSEK